MADARPRHCMVVDNTYPDPRVEREGRALVAAGWDVDVISLRRPNEPRRERIDGIDVHRVPVRRQRGRSLAIQLGEYLAFLGWATAALTSRHLRRRYDVVQVHNVPDFLAFSALFTKLGGVPLLLDLHDLMPEFYASRFGGTMDALPVRLVRGQERASAGFADHVITVTHLWRDTLVARGVPAEKVDVVMNVPDDAYFTPQPPRVRADPRPLRLVYHGTITHRYGVDLLVRAVALARERMPIHLVIHGRGELVPELERLIAELGVEREVELSTTFMPTSELPGFISRADLGVVPNRRDVFTDGILPTKLLEYVTLGLPTIVARSSATEAYFDDTMVRYVPPDDARALADAIVELGADSERRRSLAERASAFTDDHRWSVEAARYVGIVERLRERGRVPSR